MASRTRTEEVAWAAGLFEGEGSFCSSKRKPPAQGFNVRMGMTQTDIDVLVHFQEVVECGRLLPRKASQPHNKPQFVWYINDFEHVQNLICLLWPWLGTRRQARAKEMLLNFRSNRRRVRGQRITTV